MDLLEKEKVKPNLVLGKGDHVLNYLLCSHSKVIDKVQERDGWAVYMYLDLKKKV